MRSFAIAAISLFTLGAIARPAPSQERRDATCLNDQQANQVANNFATLISAYTNESAQAYLCTDVHDYSDSVITLMDGGCPSTAPPGNPFPFIPLGSATFDSLSNFEAGQGGQPNITFDILNVWHSCSEVIVRWRSPLPNPYSHATEEQVTGIIVLETAFNGWQSAQPFLIDTVYSEFNSGAWLVDLGVFTPTCSNSTAKRSVEYRSPLKQ